jgi:hypothetical protein
MGTSIPETRLTQLVSVLVNGVERTHDVAANFDGPFKRQRFHSSIDRHREMHTASSAHGSFKGANQAQPLEGALYGSPALLDIRKKQSRFLSR